MAGFYVECPGCANPLYDDGQMSGDLVMCPRCGQQFQMPVSDQGMPSQSQELVGQLAAAMVTMTQQRRAQPVFLVSGPISRSGRLFARLLFAGFVIGTLAGTAMLVALSSHNEKELKQRHQLIDPIQAHHEAELKAEEANRDGQIAEIEKELRKLSDISSAKMVASTDALIKSIKNPSDREDLEHAQRQETAALEAERSAKRDLTEKIEQLRTLSGRRQSAINRRYQLLYEQAEAKLAGSK